MVGQFLDILSDGNKTVAAGVHVEAAQGLSASLHQPRQFTLKISFVKALRCEVWIVRFFFS